MLIQATAKNIRISPTKVSLVTEKIKKMKPQNAISYLDFIPNASARPLKKVLASAVANAKNNHGIKEDALFIKEIIVNKGPAFKRFKAIARGRAHSILRRTSHIRVVLENKEEELPKTVEKKSETKLVAPIKEPIEKNESQAKTKGAKRGTKG